MVMDWLFSSCLLNDCLKDCLRLPISLLEGDVAVVGPMAIILLPSYSMSLGCVENLHTSTIMATSAQSKHDAKVHREPKNNEHVVIARYPGSRGSCPNSTSRPFTKSS